MRVVSQDGEFDFPYEQIVVMLNDNHVICKPISDVGGRYYTLASYSAEEKAEKAIMTMRESYESSCYSTDVFDMSAHNTVPHVIKNNAVFQFPQEGF